MCSHMIGHLVGLLLHFCHINRFDRMLRLANHFKANLFRHHGIARIAFHYIEIRFHRLIADSVVADHG